MSFGLAFSGILQRTCFKCYHAFASLRKSVCETYFKPSQPFHSVPRVINESRWTMRYVNLCKYMNPCDFCCKIYAQHMFSMAVSSYCKSDKVWKMKHVRLAHIDAFYVYVCIYIYIYIYILNNLTQYVGMHKLCLNGAHFQICSTAWIENSTVGYPWHMSAGLRHHGRCRCPGAKETPSYQQKPGWFRWGTGIRWIVLCD